MPSLSSSLQRVAVFSSGVRKIMGLAGFLGVEELLFRPRSGAGCEAVVGWGQKPTARRAERFASEQGLPYWRLEDGFLRSVASGPRVAPLSLVIDDLGIYYDARGPSRLEAWLESGPFPASLLERAEGCLGLVREAGLSKYNDQSLGLPRELPSGECALVVDQTRGDASIVGGFAQARDFELMLEAALDEHPRLPVVVKTHPDVIAGRKQGYLTDTSRLSPAARRRVRLLGTNVHPHRLVERASAVYVVTSQLGFEALLLGRPVHCFGVPFYAGWGLTHDRQAGSSGVAKWRERRTARRSLVELVAAAWLLYPRYLHPIRGERCEAEDVISHLALQRRYFGENAASMRAYGFARWKRRYVTRYLASPDGSLAFGGSPGPGEQVLVWGTSAPATSTATQPPDSGTASPSSWHMEDGFLRSVGLGSDLTQPRSLVVDRLGLHYDPSRPSELEELLSRADFEPAELERAARLRERIVELALSKYNPSPRGGPQDVALAAALAKAGERTVVLVPGQVEDDASVLLGGAGIQTNAELLERVRAARPEAFLLYKPHPDVVSKNRRGALPPDAARLADHIEPRASLPSCLAASGEVHVLTSLVGFEALLRGIPVATYGQPFYASWGLTTDRAPVARRTRRLQLDELVAGTLLRYPRYYSFRAGAFATAEDIVFELERDREQLGSLPVDAPRLVRQAERLGRWVREVLGAR